MKKKLYISLFSLFGVMLAIIFSALMEISVINRYLSDGGVMMTTDDMSRSLKIYAAVSLAVVVIGALLGFMAGKKAWKILYEDGRYNKFFKKPLKKEF
jgi:hypothetical protein